MRRWLFRIMAGAGLAIPLSAQAQVLEPAGEWNMRESEKSCRAYRYFGSGEQGTALQIESFGTHTPFEIMVRNESLSRDNNAAHIVDLQFGPDGDGQRTYGVVGSLADVPILRVLASTARPMQLFVHGRVDERLPVIAAIDPSAATFTIDTNRIDPITLRQGAMAEVLDWLEECETRLSTKWGFDPSEIASAPELLNYREVDAVMHYPDNMVINRVSQMVQFRIVVDEDGEPSECIVQAPDWDSSFEENVCRAIDRVARFEPARDVEGNPVPFVYRSATFFLLFD